MRMKLFLAAGAIALGGFVAATAGAARGGIAYAFVGKLTLRRPAATSRSASSAERPPRCARCSAIRSSRRSRTPKFSWLLSSGYCSTETSSREIAPPSWFWAFWKA